MTRSEYAVISAGGWFRVAYDPEEMKFAFNEMVEGAAVRLLFHAWACDPMLEDRRLARMTFQDKSGRFAIRAAVMIDATSHEDLTYAELECRKRVMAEIDRLRRECPVSATAASKVWSMSSRRSTYRPRSLRLSVMPS